MKRSMNFRGRAGSRLTTANLDALMKQYGVERPYLLYVSDRLAGRFSTLSAAQAEEERICRLAQRDGHAVTTDIVQMRKSNPAI